MKAYKTSYELPPAPYRPGQTIRIQGQTFKVLSSTHTHTQLEGIRYGVANWVIEQMRKSPEEFALLRENTDSSVQSYIYDDQKLAPTPSEHNPSILGEGRCPTDSDLRLFLGALYYAVFQHSINFKFQEKFG